MILSTTHTAKRAAIIAKTTLTSRWMALRWDSVSMIALSECLGELVQRGYLLQRDQCRALLHHEVQVG